MKMGVFTMTKYSLSILTIIVHGNWLMQMVDFFVNRVCNSCPETLEDLQCHIMCGDHSFLQKLQYFQVV